MIRNAKGAGAREPGLRILVGVDFSRESRIAVAEARRLAAACGSSITLAHVRPLSDIRAAVVEERGDFLKADAGSLRGRLAAHYEKKLQAMRKGEARERTLLLRGKPALELCREARRGYDLLVMGSRGQGGVLNALLGSTVEETLATSAVPVLVAPSRRGRPARKAARRS